MGDAPRYWFRAKRYGWGWGPPAVWEGWLALLAFLVALGVGPLLLPPDQNPAAFSTYAFLVTGTFVATCFATGEPPRWRWGDADETPRG